jgi:hypothetical protein
MVAAMYRPVVAGGVHGTSRIHTVPEDLLCASPPPSLSNGPSLEQTRSKAYGNVKPLRRDLRRTCPSPAINSYSAAACSSPLPGTSVINRL